MIDRAVNWGPSKSREVMCLTVPTYPKDALVAVLRRAKERDPCTSVQGSRVVPVVHALSASAERHKPDASEMLQGSGAQCGRLSYASVA